MKKALFCSIIAALLSVKAVAADPLQKYSSYPPEEQTQIVSVNLSGVQVKALRYGDTRLRLIHAEGTATPQFRILGPTLQKGLDSFLATCEKNRKYQIFDAVSDDQNLYKLRGEFLPLHQGVFSGNIQGVQDETIYLQRNLNVPVGPEFIGPHQKSAGIDSGKVRALFESQLSKQKDQVWETGVVEFDLTGYDAIVCDLVSKSSQLKLVTGIQVPSAQPSRKPVIGSQDLLKVVELMEKQNPRGSDASGKVIFRAAQLGSALSQVLQTNAESFGEGNIDKLFRAMIDSRTGSMLLNSRDFQGIQKASRSMDELLYGLDYSNIWVQPSVVL